MNTPSILNKLLSNRQYVFDYQPFRHFIEENLVWALQDKHVDTHRVDPTNAYRFRYDLAAYLLNENIPFEYHWLYMRLNDMKYNWDFNENTKVLYFLKSDVIDQLIGQFSLLNSVN